MTCKFHCSTGPAFFISRILNIEETLSFAGALTFCRTKFKVSMNQVHGARNVGEKCQGNAANQSRVQSRTNLEVTDGRTDGRMGRQTDRQAYSSIPPPLHCRGYNNHHSNHSSVKNRLYVFFLYV